MRIIHVKRAVLILAVVVLTVEGYYVYRFYDTSYTFTAPGTGVSEMKAQTTTEPEKTTLGGSTVASVGEVTAAGQQEVGSQQGVAEYVEAVGDIQTKAVETLVDSHKKLLAYDALSAADVEEMGDNETALRSMSARAADLVPPPKYEEQHGAFVAAMDQLREAAGLAHGMAADPVAVTDTAFDEYDGRVGEASALLRRSNDLLGEQYETIGGVREVSPEF